jgi:hypothetical protein
MGDLASLPSKNVRAIRFYLISQGVADADHVYHQFDSRLRAFNDSPIVDVMQKPIGPEEQFTGNDISIIEIQVKFQAVNQPNQQAEAQRIAFDAVVGKVRTAMMQSDDGQTLRATAAAINAAAYAAATAPGDGGIGDYTAKANADLNDYTLKALYQDVYGNAKDEFVNWAIVQRYKIESCETKLT